MITRTTPATDSSQGRIALILLVPTFLIVAPIAIFPFFYSIYLSLYDFSASGTHFLGLEHYKNALNSADFVKTDNTAWT